MTSKSPTTTMSDQGAPPAGGPQRLALCITELEAGGAERALVALATRLDRAEFEIRVYCLGPRPSDDTSCVDTLEQAGIKIEFLNGRSVWSALVVLRQLQRLWKVQRPDVVLTFLFHANVLGRIAARWAGVPIVVCGIRVAERASRWHLWLDRWTSRLVDQYVCVSDAVADFSSDVARLPAERITVIPNGVDVGRFRDVEPLDLGHLGIAAGRRVICFVGRLEKQKGVAWLIEFAPELFDRLPEHDLLLVGTGPEREILHQRCRESGIADRVHFAGWRRDVPAILAACDLLVLPSAWEGMPNVVLEAMASARPVVATDVEGVRQVLGPLAEPQTVPPKDAEAFIGKVVAPAQDPEARARLGAENRRRAESFFSLDAMAGAYAELLQSLRAAPRSGRKFF